MSTTLRQVAQRAGVDASTVSRVLRGDPNLSVRQETRERIEQVARELNYHPNAAARSLKLRATRTIGMAVPDITNPLFPAIFKGVEATARQFGYTVILVNTADPQEDHSHINLLTERRIDGLILATALTADDTIRRLIETGYPFVLVNRRYPDLAERFVVPDDMSGARQAVEHLIQLGHAAIGHISGPLFTDTGLNRLRAYRDTLRQHGLPFESGWMVESDFRERSGYEAMQRLLDHPHRPTAVFCANDLVSIGAISAIRARGLRIPHDISLVGFNDLPWMDHLQPPLTTVHVPLYEMGVHACRMLLQVLAGEAPEPASRQVPVSLVIRSSTGAPPA